MNEYLAVLGMMQLILSIFNMPGLISGVLLVSR